AGAFSLLTNHLLSSDPADDHRERLHWPHSLVNPCDRQSAFRIIALTPVGEDRDAPAPGDPKLRGADTGIRARTGHHRGGDGHRGEDAVVLWKRRGVSASHVWHVLKPFAVLRINDAERLHRRGSGIRPGNVKATVDWVVPDLIASTDLLDHIEQLQR